LLAIIESHPVQYHAPVYRALQTEFGIPVTAIYGSDIGVVGYRDREFGISVSWDSDLLSGYDVRFLSRASGTEGVEPDRVRARGVGELLKRLKPRAVMLVGYASRFDRAALCAAVPTRLPLLFRAETTDHAIARSGTRAWVRDQALGVLYSRMARVLYIGQRSLAHYKRLGLPDHKLVFAPYCVDTAPFACDEAARAAMRGPLRAELGLAENDIALLFAGKISERKGADLVVEAVRQLPASLRSRMTVCVLGDGEMRAQIETLAADTPRVRVHFLGFQNQTRLSRYYHAADLMVLPSRRGETWGLVVNEALHHGTPCVVSDAVGCSPDLIQPGATGHTFHTGSAMSLAAAVRSAMSLTGRADKRERCRAQVSQYTVAAAARGIAQAYTELQHGDAARLATYSPAPPPAQSRP
jgi:glycosyltransferase involved in cell wall biosynthesis